MADLNALVESLSELTVLEAAELSKMLEEKWGVSAAAAVAAAPAAGGGAAAPAAEVLPAPVPPTDSQAFFPSRLHNKSQTRSGLASLFGMN